MHHNLNDPGEESDGRESSAAGRFQTSTSSTKYISECTKQDLSNFNRSGCNRYAGRENVVRPKTYHGDSVSVDTQFPSKSVPSQQIARDLPCNIDRISSVIIVQPNPERGSREFGSTLEQSLTSPPWQCIREEIVTSGWIIFFAIWGALTRISFSALSTFPGQQVPNLIWAQFIGCAIMGFLVQDTTLFPKPHRYQPLYVGLSTGFCGSLTSFSGWIWEIFTSLANFDPHFDRIVVQSWLAGLSQVIITLAAGLIALRFGAHISDALQPRLQMISKNGKYKEILDRIGVIAGIIAWSIAIVVAASTARFRGILLTAVFAPAGIYKSYPS